MCWLRHYQFLKDDTVVYPLTNCEANRSVRIADKSSENVATFRYFRMALTNQNCTYEKIKRDKIQRMPTTIWSRTFCFPVRHPKTHKIKYTDLQLFLCLCGCEPSCLTLTEEHGLRLFKNRGTREDIWAWEGKKKQENWESSIMWVSQLILLTGYY